MRRLRFPIWDYRDIDNFKKKEKPSCCRGSVTLEAAIFLPMFILFSVAMMDLIQIGRAQTILQYAVNSAAKEISIYSYVLTKGGVTGKRVETSENADACKGKMTELVDGLEGVQKSLGSGNPGNVINAGTDLYSVLKKLAGEYGEDLEKLGKDATDVSKQWAADKVSAFLIESYVKPRVEACIRMMSEKEPGAYLESLGILGGCTSLDYSHSKWAAEKKGDLVVLEVVVEYPVEIKLGWIHLPERRFRVRAKTAIW